MKKLVALACVLSLLALSVAAMAATDRTKIGSCKLHKGDEKFEISLGTGSEYGKLQFRIKNAKVKVEKVTVTYGNGERQTFTFGKTFVSGDFSAKMKLKHRRVIRNVAFHGKVKNTSNGSIVLYSVR